MSNKSQVIDCLLMFSIFLKTWYNDNIPSSTFQKKIVILEISIVIQSFSQMYGT